MKNFRKIPGAYVWLGNEIGRITNQKVEHGWVIVNNLHKRFVFTLRLVKIGSKVTYRDLSVLPKRCENHGEMIITGFLDNGLILTDKALNENDYTDFRHFTR